MLLIAKYKSGEIRRVNLHPSFFASYELSISKRALDFAQMHGQQLYQVIVYRGGEQVFENTFRGNIPEDKSNPFQVDEKKVKKAFRNEFKRQKFTQRILIHG